MAEGLKVSHSAVFVFLMGNQGGCEKSPVVGLSLSYSDSKKSPQIDPWLPDVQIVIVKLKGGSSCSCKEKAPSDFIRLNFRRQEGEAFSITDPFDAADIPGVRHGYLLD